MNVGYFILFISIIMIKKKKYCIINILQKTIFHKRRKIKTNHKLIKPVTNLQIWQEPSKKFLITSWGVGGSGIIPVFGKTLKMGPLGFHFSFHFF